MSSASYFDKCKHGKPIFKFSFDLMNSFVKKASNNRQPYFILNFLNQYTHDDFRVPPNVDVGLKNALEELEKGNYLENTLLIVFGDHGNRLTKYSYETLQGKMERYLPFLSILLPKKLWNTSYHLNAIRNKNKLVTAFDVHQTLRNFLHLNVNYTRELDNKQFSVNDKYIRYLRGISLFENIPSNRTCSDALIPDNYCPCIKMLKINERDFEQHTNIEIEVAKEFILNYINNLTSKIRDKCMPFHFHKIEKIHKKLTNINKEYQFVVILEPGSAWFEINIKFNDVDHKLGVNDKVIRLSRYDNQSSCVKDSFLRNYCFCKSG